MSHINNGLSFYVMQLDDESYGVYNQMTDKNILFGVDKDDVESFLAMNNPNHPFFLGECEDAYSLTISNDFWDDMTKEDNDNDLPSYLDNIKNNLGYSILTEKNLDYSVDYNYHNPFLLSGSDLQLSFSFMDKPSKITESEEEVTEDDIPFLPDDE